MTIHQSCGGEIAEGAVVCKHCGAQLGVPKRPKGVTVIAVLCFIGAGFSLLALPTIDSTNSVMLGLRVPVIVVQLVGLIMVGLSVYCGVGFLKLKALARQIFLWTAIYSIVQTVTSSPVILSSMNVPSEAIVPGIVGMIFGLALYGYILYYLFRQKDYFVN